MMRLLFVISYWLIVIGASAQTVTQKLQKAFATFEKDSQLKHAISSLYVIDANTGQVVFDKNSQIGLAPASTQKIITSVTAFELLGKDYRYKTNLSYDGALRNNILMGNIYLEGSGDPTLGSWRYKSTDPDIFYNEIIAGIKKAGIDKLYDKSFGFVFDKKNFSDDLNPGGWIWEDIANYYGAGSSAINWRENQFDVLFTPGIKEGEFVALNEFRPKYASKWLNIFNKLITGPKGSGDNAFFYYTPGFISDEITLEVRGTLPANEKLYSVSATHPNPSKYLSYFLFSKTEEEGHKNDSVYFLRIGDFFIESNKQRNVLFTHYSPTLDSIIYWFNKKSINLYGEALIKTFAYEKNGFGSTDSGVAIVKKFWKEKGMDENELNIVDGSGLSPLDRVTTHAQVEILKYAKSKDWFPYFFNALPEYNKMTMKSGTINGVKGFCGYHKSKDGKEYIFSFLVNNYNGSASSLVNKMYKVLDVLK